MIAGEDEVVEYDTKCDVWSFGLLVWSMLNHGRSPLADMKTAEEIASAIMNPSFQPRLSDFDNDYSLLVDDFLGKCLRRDPAKRWSCQELLKHDFITSRTSGLNQNVLSEFIKKWI
jgi:serine/threonine protein kinase